MNTFLILCAVVFIGSGVYAIFTVSLSGALNIALSITGAIEISIGIVLSRTVIVTREQIAAEFFGDHVLIYPFMWGGIKSLAYQDVDNIELSKSGRTLFIYVYNRSSYVRISLASFAEPEAFVRIFHQELNRFHS